MFRIWCGALFGLILGCSSLFALEAVGTLRRVDANRGVVVVFANGQDRTLRADKSVKILDTQGKDLPSGLLARELQAGTEVTVTVEFENNQPVLKTLRLGRSAAPPAMTGRTSVGLTPLTEMSAQDKYKGEDGGLYGGGKNEPPADHLAAAARETAKIVPRDLAGNPAANGVSNGKIALISISMSNATQEFSAFKRLADADPDKSPLLTVVDCAQGGQAMAEWVLPDARPWVEADRRLQAAGISNQQVQIAWIKLANKGPRDDLAEHGKKLQKDATAVVQNAKSRFPNLQVVYLGSRIYGGYTTISLNPEPYAYESAFAVRWLIQDQIAGNTALNYDASRGSVKAPLLLWGPYFWADGITPRKSDQLIYERQDLAADGTHPSAIGQRKVAEQLLKFFKTDPQAKAWFVKR